jgi:hypothetical protein
MPDVKSDGAGGSGLAVVATGIDLGRSDGGLPA